MYRSPLHPTLYIGGTKPSDYLSQLIHIHERDGLTTENEVELRAGLWRLVIDTEAAVNEGDVHIALDHIAKTLYHMDSQAKVCVYVRARDPFVMAQILEMEGVEKITGFVIPKADPDEFPWYADQVLGSNFLLMPILESRLMNDYSFRKDLRLVFEDSTYRRLIDCLRLGANDLLGYHGMRHNTKDLTVHDDAVGTLIHIILGEYRALSGFTITAPVFEGYSSQYLSLLAKEVEQNVQNGLFGQTAIHIRQLRTIRDLYKVSPQELESALAMTGKDVAAVQGRNGRMDEVTTHGGLWSDNIRMRSYLFGDSSTS